MSLINKMLHDLEKRKQSSDTGKEEKDVLSDLSAPVLIKKNRSKWAPIILLIITLIIVLGIALYLYWPIKPSEVIPQIKKIPVKLEANISRPKKNVKPIPIIIKNRVSFG